MIGREQTGRLMRKAGLQGIRRGRKPMTTCGSKTVDARLDLVDRKFTAVGPNRLWVADIERHEAFLNLAVMKGHRSASVAAVA